MSRLMRFHPALLWLAANLVVFALPRGAIPGYDTGGPALALWLVILLVTAPFRVIGSFLAWAGVPDAPRAVVTLLLGSAIFVAVDVALLRAAARPAGIDRQRQEPVEE